MGGELRIRIADERTPPAVEGLEAGDGEWRLSLEPHRDLLVDVTGVDPTGELGLRELATIRARLEGYVERARQASSESPERTDERERSPGGALRRLLSLLVGAVPLVGPTRAREPTDRTAEAERSYETDRVRRLARVFRAAAEAQRRRITAASAAPATDAAAD